MDLLQYIIDTNYNPEKLVAFLAVEKINERDETGKTPLIRATIKGDVKAVQILVHLEADVDLEDNQGNKATYYAAIHGYPKILAILLKSGCGG